MNGTLIGVLDTYITARHLRVQTDVEDQDVVSYIYAAPSASVMPGQPGTDLVDTVRTPLIEMKLAEQHDRIVQEIYAGTHGWS
ncbi:MAG TPA: hypothetical protein VFE42_34320 [Chloroflexota bacterium]|jgi:hypothetical protein|nr:hypothetical protein [Chloroflexota bacterium]